MADKKISDLPKLGKLSGDELIPVVKDGINYSVQSSNIGSSGTIQDITNVDIDSLFLT